MKKVVIKKVAAIVSTTMVVAVISSVGLYAAGIRINTSSSIPVGLYWLTKKPLVKGNYVIFCPPERSIFFVARARGYIGSGFCPGGFGYLMKKAVADKTDVVSITAAGVWVDGLLLPHSQPLQHDGSGRFLSYPRIQNYALRNNELLLMTDKSPHSFDARYFGPITQSHIKGVIKPLFTW